MSDITITVSLRLDFEESAVLLSLNGKDVAVLPEEWIEDSSDETAEKLAEFIDLQIGLYRRIEARKAGAIPTNLRRTPSSTFQKMKELVASCPTTDVGILDRVKAVEAYAEHK